MERAKKNVKRKITVLTICALLFAFCVSAQAQQAAKIRRIGFLVPSSPGAFSVRREAFRQGLRELGYVEGENISIDYRFAEQGKLLPETAAELVRLKVDVIVATGTIAGQAVKQTTGTVPIVAAAMGDPVRSGLVSTLARPGGNLTGFTNGDPEISGKRLEILKESFPGTSRVVVLWSRTSEFSWIKENETVARTLGLRLHSLEVRNVDDFEPAFRAASRETAGALATLNHHLITFYQKLIIDLAAKHRLPAIYHNTLFVEAGGLMSYAPDLLDLYRRAAYYVDKILKGAKPADLPVEQPTKFELVINLKTAKQLGLTIPPKVLMWADKVIK